MLLRTFITTILFIAACHPTSGGNLSAELQSSSSAKGPLAIVGTWQATDVWGSTDESGTRQAVHSKADDLKNGLWRIRTEIDSTGSGLIQGLMKCQGPATAMSTPRKIHSFQVINSLFGLMSLPGLIKQTADGIHCASSPDAAISSLLPVSPARNFFGQDLNSLAKNLGVFGEEKSLKAADAECLKMRGVRFINIKDASACVGFTDSSANKIRFLIVPVGEIYAMRVNMQRD